ncbi:hypothetical protein XENORESO_000885 [Xenotaenia resolanae]|uniref:Ig-like domain-containing protein n=1 Tax=Xenotaenia resolanae TaxID=208358 RepID=A0ABV0WL50_9TELE
MQHLICTCLHKNIRSSAFWKMFSLVPRTRQSKKERRFSCSVYLEKVHLRQTSRGSKMDRCSQEADSFSLKIIQGPDNITVTMGTEVSMQCTVRGFPVPMVHWFKDGCLLSSCSASFSLLNNGQLLILRSSFAVYQLDEKRPLEANRRQDCSGRNATLYIQSARIYDEAVYVCEASNILGKSHSTALLRVAVSPIIVTYISRVNSDIGTSVVLPCRAVGILPITYSWARAETQSPVGHTENIHVDEDGALHLSSVQYSDAGEYTCTAENRAGRHQRRAILNVTGVLTKTPQLIIVQGDLQQSRTLNQLTMYWHSRRQHVCTYRKQMNFYNSAHQLCRGTQQSPSWLPVLEKHDIPIVVGVGISLAFIFITVTFYSMVQKNEPTPPVIEQSPNTSDTRARPQGPSLVTVQMEPTFEEIQEVSHPTVDHYSVTVETHPEPIVDTKIDSSLEEDKRCSLSLPSIQLQCEDWTSTTGQNHSPSQDAFPPPSSLPSHSPSPSPSPPSRREEALHSSLTLQSAEPCAAPIHHSLSISHVSPPLLVSHHVSLGLTSIAVDVQVYPTASASTALSTSTHINSVSNSGSVTAPLFSPPLFNNQENDDRSTARLHQSK